MTLKIPFIFSLIIHVTIIAIFTLNEQSLVRTKTSIIKIDIISTKVENVQKNAFSKKKIPPFISIFCSFSPSSHNTADFLIHLGKEIL